MSLRYEQCSALLRTREFLRELMLPGKVTKKGLRERAYRCLKHYPHPTENGMPMFSKDGFTTPDGGMVK